MKFFSTKASFLLLKIKMFVQVLIGLVCLAFLAAYLSLYLHVQTLLAQMDEDPVPEWLENEAKEIVTRKRSRRKMHCTVVKALLKKAEPGITRWDDFVALMEQEAQRISETIQEGCKIDAIVGITSGGWLTALCLARVLNLPCYQLKYSRYGKTGLKTLQYFLGKRVAAKGRTRRRPPSLREGPEILKGLRILLVDDTVGSGATLKVCRDFVSKLCAHVWTYVVCSTCTARPGLVDMCHTSNLFLIYPWGLDD